MRATMFRGAGSSLLLVLLLVAAAATSQQGAGSQVPAKATQGSAQSSTKRSAASAPEEPSPFHITGKVINSLSRAPVARAEVAVSPMGARRSNGRFAGRAAGQTAGATTDAEGRFSVEVPSAGGWSLSVAAHGFHTQAFEEHGGFSTAVILTDANPVQEVVFLLTPASGIEGYVLDEGGEAVRNAQLTVSLIPPATPDDQHPRRQTRGNQRTDDRGYYRFSGLLSGNYDVRVQAHPWYATNGGAGRSTIIGGIGTVAGSISSGSPATIVAGPESSEPDPLDVVYPMVWYPGVTDFAAATPIAVRGGETKEANFRLLPAPGFNLRIPGQPLTNDEGGVRPDQRFARGNAAVSQVLPDGTETGGSLSIRVDPDGAMVYSGLAPGTYLVRGQDGSSVGTIRIAENSARTLDVSQTIPTVPVLVKVDAAAERSSLQISFRDAETGRANFVQGQREPGGRSERRGRGSTDIAPPDPAEPARAEDAPDRFINLQPGRYEVMLNGIGDLHLTGIDAKGATAIGRTVTITGGAPVLTLHVAGGRANVTGFVQSHGKPIEGAMVLLVPATLGDPSGLEVTRRDQSNTDGSFDIGSVLPGAYILVAIDHGWEMNWSDPATLRQFLMRGVPLDLSNGGERKVTVDAQAP